MRNYYWEIKWVHQDFELEEALKKIQEVWIIDRIFKSGYSWMIFVRKLK